MGYWDKHRGGSSGSNKKRDPYWRSIYNVAEAVESQQRAFSEDSNKHMTMPCPCCGGSKRVPSGPFGGYEKCRSCNGTGRTPVGTRTDDAVRKHKTRSLSLGYRQHRETSKW